LREQVERQLEAGQNVVLDLDVNGGLRVKQIYGNRAMSLFIQPPSIEALRQRLIARATDAPEVIEERIARAEYELSQAPHYDRIIINDDLEQAKAEAYETVKAFLNK